MTSAATSASKETRIEELLPQELQSRSAASRAAVVTNPPLGALIGTSTRGGRCGRFSIARLDSPDRAERRQDASRCRAHGCDDRRHGSRSSPAGAGRSASSPCRTGAVRFATSASSPPADGDQCEDGTEVEIRPASRTSSSPATTPGCSATSGSSASCFDRRTAEEYAKGSGHVRSMPDGVASLRRPGRSARSSCPFLVVGRMLWTPEPGKRRCPELRARVLLDQRRGRAIAISASCCCSRRRTMTSDTSIALAYVFVAGIAVLFVSLAALSGTCPAARAPVRGDRGVGRPCGGA